MQIEEKKKRERSANFTTQEKSVLLSIIAKHKNVIENKKTDAVSCNEKNSAWQKITCEFNSISPNLYERSTESLKKFYDNKKKEIRKSVAEERKQILLTGGGVIEKPQTDPNKDVMLSIINQTSVYGTTNKFDGDGIPFVSNLQADDNVILEFSQEDKENEYISDTNEDISHLKQTQSSDIEIIEEDSHVANKMNKTWKKYKASDLGKPMNRRLQNKSMEDGSPSKKMKYESCRRRPATIVKALSSSTLAEKYDMLIDKRLAIADYELQKQKGEIEFNKEEQKLKIKLLQVSIDLKQKQLDNIK